MKATRNTIALLGTVFTVLLFSCSKSKNETELVKDNSPSFYKEIFFASAKNSKLSHVQDIIFARSSAPTTTSDKTQQMETLLADKISTLSPDFYSVFNAKMQSGDHTC